MKEAIKRFQDAREEIIKSMFGIAGITIEIFGAAHEADKAINKLNDLLTDIESASACEICGRPSKRLWTVDGNITCDSCMDDRERGMDLAVERLNEMA